MSNINAERVIKTLNEEFGNIDGAVVYHKDKDGKQVMSPIIQASSVQETLQKLLYFRNGLDNLISDIVSKSKEN